MPCPHMKLSDLITICKHVEAGRKPDVLFGSILGTEIAVCSDCADVLNLDGPPGLSAPLLSMICKRCAPKLGVPATLPGPKGFYDSDLDLLQVA